MTDHDTDRILDDALEGMRAEKPDARRAEEAAKRAWARVRSEAPASAHGWSAATGHDAHRTFSVPATAADGPRRPSIAARTLASRPARFALAAAAAVAIMLGLGTFAGRMTIGGQVGQVHAMEGSLVRLDGGATHALASGEAVESGSAVRTGDDGRAVLQLSDGTTIEMDERSELRMDRTLFGPAIRVVRGRVLVTGGDGKAKILTPELEVMGDGQTYLVNQGVMGTRVTVLDGTVRLDGSEGESELAAGQQFTSSDSLEGAPLEQELSWSQDAALYADLVTQIKANNQNVSDALANAPVRTASGIPDRVPAGTVIYAAFPNVVDEVLDGQMQLFERLRENPSLADQFTADKPGESPELDELTKLFEQLQTVTTHLGDEIVVAWVLEGERPDAVSPAMAFGEVPDHEPTPLILAPVANEKDLTAALAALTPSAPELESEMSIEVAGGLFAASPSAELVAAVAGGAQPGLQGDFRSVVDQAYARGVTWLGAVDLESMGAAQAADASDDDRAVMERSGLLDARYLVVEHKADETRAHLSFDGARHGMAAWLAEPAPVGALAYVSGDATLAGAFASKDGSAMFDDMVGIMFGMDSAEAEADLAELKAETGVDFRQDIAGAVGGEIAFALDGAVLPEPAWKLVVEVVDPARLQPALEAMIARNTSEDGDMSLVAEEGRLSTLYTVRIGDEDVATYTFSDGYLVAAPRRELVERALRYKADGFTLERSSTFRSLLPTDARPHFSALWYQNLGPVLEPLSQAGQIVGGEVPREALTFLSALEPSVAVAYAEENGISVASRGGMGPFGLDVVGMMSSAQAMSLTDGAKAPAGLPVQPEQ